MLPSNHINAVAFFTDQFSRSCHIQGTALCVRIFVMDLKYCRANVTLGITMILIVDGLTINTRTQYRITIQTRGHFF
jgi:hypothetical protein